MAKQDYSRAFLEFRNAVQADPASAEAYFQLALASLANKDARNAEVWLRKATELDPKHRDAQVKLAELLSTGHYRERVDESARRVREVLAVTPSDVEAANILAGAEWRLGQREQAEARLVKAIEESPKNLGTHFSLIRLKLAGRDYAEAEKLLTKLASAHPGQPAVFLAVGAFYAFRGRSEEAADALRKALAIEPSNGLVLVSLAGLEQQAGRLEEAGQLYQRAAQLNDPQYKHLHAFFLLNSGRADAALAELETLAKAEPDNRGARSRLVAAYLATGRKQRAEAVLNEALKLHRHDADALLQRGQMRIRAGEWDQAEADLTTVVGFHPGSAPAHYLMSKIHQQRGRLRRQREELGEAIRLDPELLAPRIELAQILTFSGSAREALDLLDAAPPSQRSSLPVAVQRNWAHLARSDAKAAAKGIQEGLASVRGSSAHRPIEGLLKLQEGLLKAAQQDWTGARTSLGAALDIHPGNVSILKAIQQSYDGQQQRVAGLKVLREYARRNPGAAAVQLYVGELCLESADLPGAREALDAAKAADPQSVPVEWSLARLELAESQPGKARQRLETLVAANPKDGTAYLLLGDLEERQGDAARAIGHYRRAAALQEGNPIALNNLAYLLAESNKAEEALAFAEKARDIAPDHPAIQDTVGWVYFRKGVYSQAITHLERAVNGEPTLARKCRLGLAYLQGGDRKRGQETIVAALREEGSQANTKLGPRLSYEVASALSGAQQ